MDRTVASKNVTVIEHSEDEVEKRIEVPEAVSVKEMPGPCTTVKGKTGHSAEETVRNKNRFSKISRLLKIRP